MVLFVVFDLIVEMGMVVIIFELEIELSCLLVYWLGWKVYWYYGGVEGIDWWYKI